MAAGSLDIGSFSTGVSADGMNDYMESLKTKYITETRDLLDDVEEINNAINQGWQGVSKDNFMEQFEKAREVVKEDLDKEYQNFQNRLDELSAQYFETDQNLLND